MPPNNTNRQGNQRGNGTASRQSNTSRNTTTTSTRTTTNNSSSTSTHKTRNPHFGLEIEIFVRVKSNVESGVLAAMRDGTPINPLWRQFDFNLNNYRDEMTIGRRGVQREVVGKLIKSMLDNELADDHGWICEADASLKEWTLQDPSPRANKWWGIEIISPALAANSDWQDQIKRVFSAVTATFELRTAEVCACHVHVSPGPNKKADYTMDQMLQIIKGAYFFEEGFRGLLPQERRVNRYALPNYEYYGRDEYRSVPSNGWAPVFKKIDALKKLNTTSAVAKRMTVAKEHLPVNDDDRYTRYTSSNLGAYLRHHTIELRRQAGVASARTAIRRVLLALTLHTASLKFDFEKAGKAQGRRYLNTEDLIPILFTSLNNDLPKKAYDGAAFKTWMEDCEKNYRRESMNFTIFDEVEVNDREYSYHVRGKAYPPGADGPGVSTERRRVSGATLVAPRPPSRATTSGATLIQRVPASSLSSNSPRVITVEQPGQPTLHYPTASLPIRTPVSTSGPPRTTGVSSSGDTYYYTVERR
ncbi:hypothetical protein B0J18DRAFT_457863 [Chaetomium sp. MPI-SDFR-AT-0129]|nr:hypothetical protein B0J18DRAFT_457863 [Chaetomium sp. MPI-SDFR-AT-0129]